MKLEQGLTFDDVLLVPQFSEILPKEVDLKTKLTQKISLNIPILSAAMDTVTESKMAIALARQGGLGIIHKNLSIEQHSKEVDRVKRSESGMIQDPVTIESNKTIREALDIMSHFRISGVPVVDNSKLVGILTNRDIRFEKNIDLKVRDRMTKNNLITVKEGTTLDEAKLVLQEHRIEKLLVVDSNGMLSGLITVKDILKKEDFPHASVDKHGRLMVGAAVGTGTDVLDRVAALVESNVDVIVVDTAHGHSKNVLNTVKKIRKTYAGLEIIAGNVATAKGTEALINAGVNCVKVGIGAGSSCTTRIVAGVGVPQLTAVMEASKIAKKYDIPIISDGGLRYSGDIAKALTAGANSVMLGNILAGTNESPGEVILYKGRSFKSFRGMGSLSAMALGSKDRYFQEEKSVEKLVPEGIEGMVPYKGTLQDTIEQLTGGLRSAMGYVGSKNILVLHTNKEFIKITSSGMSESHPHDMNITKEAPNYQKPQ